MKKTILAVMLVQLAAVSHAQGLRKGNLVGTHVMTIKLEPGITMERFTDFYFDKVIPGFERARPGWKFYPVKRIRGEKADGFGLIIVISSEAERDKYYNADGSDSELGKTANAKVQPILDQMNKLGTMTSDPYTDWLVYR
jgi:hypothetical protein